jgi:hypothetical protein
MTEGLRVVLQKIQDQLEAIDKKIEAAAVQPRALGMRKAALLLSRSPDTLKGMVKRKEIRTVLIAKVKMIPMSEIVRLTTVLVPARGAPNPRRQEPYDAQAEAERARAAIRRGVHH